ncbi:Magnetosome protein MamB [Gammaproteobacteria bacterium]
MKTYRKEKCTGCAGNAARLDFLVVMAKAVFSGIMGMLTGSAGLHAVAFLASGDIISKGINWFSVYISKKPATERFPYGYGKTQFLSSLLIGVLLIGGAGLFFFHNAQHIQMGQVVPPGGLAMVSALLLAVTSEMMHRILIDTAQCSNNSAIYAAAADNRIDFISSLMVLAGTFLTYIGWTIADHLMSLAVVLLVMRVGFGIASEAIKGLLDFGLSTEVEHQIRRICSLTPQFCSVKRVYGRRLGDSFAVNLEIYVDGNCSLSLIDDAMKQAKRDIRAKVQHIDTIHFTFVPRDC